MKAGDNGAQTRNCGLFIGLPSANSAADTTLTVDDPSAALCGHASAEADLADALDLADFAWVMHGRRLAWWFVSELTGRNPANSRVNLDKKGSSLGRARGNEAV